MEKRRLGISLLAIMGLGFLLLQGGCKKDEPYTPLGHEYWYQCIWDGGPTDFSPYAEFKNAGVLVHHDDTATFNGTWTCVEETLEWSIHNPPKNTRFRGFVDQQGVSGTMSDDLGRTGWFQGSRR